MFEESGYNSQQSNSDVEVNSSKKAAIRKPRRSKYNLLTEEERKTLSKKEYSRLYSLRYSEMRREAIIGTKEESPKNSSGALEKTIQTESPISSKESEQAQYPLQEDSSQTPSNLSTAEARREYQRRYYQMHKEKAKEYQRQYNLTQKKSSNKSGRGKKALTAQREVVRSTFNTADIIHSPVEKTLKMLEKILRGERLFTMNNETPSVQLDTPSQRGMNPAGSINRIIDTSR